VLTHWHAVATMTTNPLTDDEPEQIERTKTSDYTGLNIPSGEDNDLPDLAYG